MFGSFLFRSFLTFIASLHLFVNAGEYIFETCLQFCSDEAGLIDSVNCHLLNFVLIAIRFLLYLFSHDLYALSILSPVSVSSTVGFTLLISLVKMTLLLSQDPHFLGWGIFLKIRVFLRLLFFISSISSFITVTSSLRADIWFFNWSIWKSLFSVLSVLFSIFDRLDLSMLIALVAVISTFLKVSEFLTLIFNL